MDELKEIKKLYGEDMMHLCHEMFPSLLEKPGLLVSILKNNVAPTHMLAKDIIEKEKEESFKDFIYSFLEEKPEEKVVTNKTPFELMDEAGYILYECKSEDDIQSFKKYYDPNEVLCTIYNGGRLERCHVFFAVKKNVDEIKREDFDNPKREDEYGTSVISIQFARGNNNTISIKNRYNHTVLNPDSTFSNNLEKIIPGLTDSFEKCYNLNIDISGKKNDSYKITEVGPYVQAADFKWYRYNVEQNGIFYCENNIIIKDGKVIRDYADYPERYILVDKYIFDIKEKSVSLFEKKENDVFLRTINIGKIKRIYVTKDNNEKTITIVYEDQKEVKVKIDGSNTIIGYYNDYVKIIGDAFLSFNSDIKELSLNNVSEIGNDFLKNNQNLKSISLPKVEEIGNRFLYNNLFLDKVNMPNVKLIGNDFLNRNFRLCEIEIPNVKKIGDCFCYYNNALKELSLPNVEKIGDCFLNSSRLEKINMPKLKEIGNEFLLSNNNLKELSLPNVEKVGYHFLFANKELESISMPNLVYINRNFLYNNDNLKEVSFPNVKEIDDNFLLYNKVISKVSLPKVEVIQNFFISYNEELKELSLPCLKSVGGCFLYENRKLEKLYCPKLERYATSFLHNNKGLEELSLPKVKDIILDNFLAFNKRLKKLSLPSVTKIENNFLLSNRELREIEIPNVTTIGDNFLSYNIALENIYLPKLIKHGKYFLKNNRRVQIESNFEKVGSPRSMK